MATRTSVGSGNWSSAGTWDTGVPVDGDTVIIAAGHTVVFDVDQSAFSTGVTLTVNGTFQCKTTGGPYVLKCGGDITFGSSGIFEAGSSSTPLPYATKFTVDLNGAKKFNGAGGGICRLYCTEPTIKSINLSVTESAGSTTLDVNTDVTGDSQWINGAKIRVDDIIGTLSDSEQKIINTVSSTQITITTGLSAAKGAGAWVHLIDRNIKVTGGTGYAFDAFSAGKLILCCEISGNTNGLSSCYGAQISGGTISGNTNGLNSCTGVQVSGGTISGNAYGLSWCYGAQISGGTISGNTNGLYSCTGAQVSGGTISGNTYGLSWCSGFIKSTLNNTNNLYYCAQISVYSTTFTGTENYGYTVLAQASYAESINHNGVDGAYKSWSKGGISVSCVDPSGGSESGWRQLICASATYSVFMQYYHEVQPNEWLYVDARLRKDASMSYLPRIQIVDPFDDPLVTGASPLAETAMTSDAVNETQHVAASWFNSGSIRRKVLVRVVAKNASENVYANVRRTRGTTIIGGILC